MQLAFITMYIDSWKKDDINHKSSHTVLSIAVSICFVVQLTILSETFIMIFVAILHVDNIQNMTNLKQSNGTVLSGAEKIKKLKSINPIFYTHTWFT